MVEFYQRAEVVLSGSVQKSDLDIHQSKPVPEASVLILRQSVELRKTF